MFVFAILSVGCSSEKTPRAASEGRKVEESIREATDADREHIAACEAMVLGILQARYAKAQLLRNEDDLRLLQRLSDDGELRAGQDDTLESLGIVFGQVLAARTPLRWISVEWQGERQLALQYPGTTVIAYPASMISKRVDRGEQVNFVELFRTLAAQLERMKDEPEYKRQSSK
jgi:hypothetical protein